MKQRLNISSISGTKEVTQKELEFCKAIKVTCDHIFRLQNYLERIGIIAKRIIWCEIILVFWKYVSLSLHLFLRNPPVSSNLHHLLLAFTKKNPPAPVFRLLHFFLVAANSSLPPNNLLRIEILRTIYSRCSFTFTVVSRINAHSHAKYLKYKKPFLQWITIGLHS